jgi:hypothetical protein
MKDQNSPSIFADASTDDLRGILRMIAEIPTLRPEQLRALPEWIWDKPAMQDFFQAIKAEIAHRIRK